jgi:hypothetical protein
MYFLSLAYAANVGKSDPLVSFIPMLIIIGLIVYISNKMLKRYDKKLYKEQIMPKDQNATTEHIAEYAPLPGNVKAGYICCGLSLFIVPLFLGIAAFILGIVNASKGYAGHGVAQIILSIICAYSGVMLAFT